MIKYFSTNTNKMYDNIWEAVDEDSTSNVSTTTKLDALIEELDLTRTSYIHELDILRSKYETKIADCIRKIQVIRQS